VDLRSRAGDRLHSLWISGNTTGLELKEKLEDQYKGWHVDYSRLRLDKKEIDDQRTLSEQGILQYSTLRKARLTGGGGRYSDSRVSPLLETEAEWAAL
jgi:hypothetical protein